MREVVAVLLADEAAAGEGRSLLQERHRSRSRCTCTDKVRSHRAATATIHFSCVHYITIIIIPLQFDYCDTRICAQDVTRSENITNECTLYSIYIHIYMRIYVQCIYYVLYMYIYIIHTYCVGTCSVPTLCYYDIIHKTLKSMGPKRASQVYTRDTTPRNSSLY